MEVTKNCQENSITDLSPTTPPTQECTQVDSEVFSCLMVDEPEVMDQSATSGESEASTLQPVLDSSILDPIAVSLPQHEEELEGRGEGIVKETLGETSSQSADVLKEESSDFVQQHEKDGDSTVLPGVLIDDGLLSETSNAMGALREDDLLASGHQEVVMNKSNKTTEPINPPPDHIKQIDVNRALVDTSAPFESVREAVTKFGGIVDWKAHKILTVERRKNMELELERAKEEIPEYKKQSEAAEDAKGRVLQELDSTRGLIEELKLQMERAHTEEEQAKQDCELARLRVEEMEQGIADEASVAAKAQMEVAKARHSNAVIDLKSVKDELETLRREYASLINERDLAIRKSEEAESASKEIEKKVEELAMELMAAKESLKSAQAIHLEVEGQRIAAAMAREEESLNWEKEIKQADEEIEKLNEHLSSSKDLKLKLETASTLLLNLKAELAAYMEAKLNEESNGNCSTEVEEKLKSELEEATSSKADTLALFESTKKELEDLRVSIEKAKEDVKCLRVAALSLKSELEGEKSALAATKQREGMASIAVASLEAELSRIRSEMELVQMREKQVKDKLVELPRELQQAVLEADQAKSVAQLAREELRHVREEVEQAKAGASTTESRLHAAIKEIEAAKASEKLALAAIKALQESESAHEDRPAGVTLPLEEYYALSKRAHEAEELANARVAAAMSEIQVAKEVESRSLEHLEEANREVVARREALRVAREKAEKAKEGKLGVEQELRKWRAEHEQQRKKATDSTAAAAAAVRVQHNPSPVSQSPRRSVDEKKVSRGFGGEQEPAAAAVPLVAPLPSSKVFVSGNNVEDMVMPELKKVKKKKKKSLFPRIVMFLAKKEQ